MIILGIDPGSVRCGYGVIQKSGNNFSLIDFGTIEAKQRYQNFNDRLKEIFHYLDAIIEKNNPDAAAFEAIFFAKNPQTLIKLSHARAAAIIAAANKNIPIVEYSAREIKKAVTGRGSASKEQVQFMVRSMLNINETPEFFDATDALAVALCHGIRNENFKSNKPTNWRDFLKLHPEIIISKTND